MWGLGVLIPLLGASALRVIQEPGEARVTAGDAVSLRCRVEEAESGAQLRMEWVQGNDSGRYLCRVTLEIPRYGTATGTGTELSVTPAAPGGHRAALLWGLLGGLGGPALLLGMALLGYRCCHRSSDSPTYMNAVFRARDPTKLPPPPRMKNNLYQQELRRAQGPPLPPRP